MENVEKLNSIFEELKLLTHDFMDQMFVSIDKQDIADYEKSSMHMSLLSYMVKVFVQASVAPENIEVVLETFVDAIHAQIVFEEPDLRIALEELKKERNLN